MKVYVWYTIVKVYLIFETSHYNATVQVNGTKYSLETLETVTNSFTDYSQDSINTVSHMSWIIAFYSIIALYGICLNEAQL